MREKMLMFSRLTVNSIMESWHRWVLHKKKVDLFKLHAYMHMCQHTGDIYNCGEPIQPFPTIIIVMTNIDV